MPEQKLRLEIIQAGKRLYEAGLAVARSGNLSARLDAENILITATGSFLGQLKTEDIVKVDLETLEVAGRIKPSSELPLHSLVYKNFPAQVVVHCHPPLVNGYFAVAKTLKALSFETKFYLGQVPVVPQETPTVINPQAVVDALKTNNLAVLKNHGLIAIGDKFIDALSITEALEEAVKSAALARLFEKDILDDLDLALKDNLKSREQAYQMFSLGHIRAIVDLVNKDGFIAQKGKELGLTLKLAVKLDDTQKSPTPKSLVWGFNFEQGKIVKFDSDANAPFVISAPAPIWEQVFLGKLDCFVAVTQGKMKLSGELGQLSKWYVPFTRLFALFKEVKIK